MKEKLMTLKTDVANAPWHVKVVVALGVAYLLSPIDLIPDFIPVLGQMDDLLLLGALISYVRKHGKTSL